MGTTLSGVLMFFLVILGTAEADCSSSCSSRYCFCSSMDLTSVPQDLPTTITRLDLGQNRITTFDQSDLSRYRSLEYLSLYKNSITTINSQAFYFMSKLTELPISYNQIENLTADMFIGLEKLQGLYLHNNEISYIQAGTFKSTPQVTFLNLENNKLTHLRPDMFTGLGNLQIIFLGDNEIIDIQAGTFNSTFNFILSDPYHMTFPHDINEKRHVGRFELLIDKQRFKERKKQTPKLDFLRLSNNNITTFPFSDLSTLSMYRLYLDNNKLKILPSTAYDILSSISDVKIGNNPWQCDCRMLSFREKMTGSHSFENQISCSEPSNVHGQKLLEINPEDLVCVKPTIIRFEKSVRGDNFLIQGEPLRLVCEASGIPTPDITVILPSGQNATAESDGRVTVDVNGIITITDVTAADAGLYVCIAVNHVGSTFDVFSVVDRESSPTFSLPMFVVSVSGAAAGTLLIVVVILTIWCKTCGKARSVGPDTGVVYNSSDPPSTMSRGHGARIAWTHPM